MYSIQHLKVLASDQALKLLVLVLFLSTKSINLGIGFPHRCIQKLTLEVNQVHLYSEYVAGLVLMYRYSLCSIFLEVFSYFQRFGLSLP